MSGYLSPLERRKKKAETTNSNTYVSPLERRKMEEEQRKASIPSPVNDSRYDPYFIVTKKYTYMVKSGVRFGDIVL